MSGSYLARVFREVTGHAPIEYLIHMRVRKAMELLRDTPWSVTKIAASVGFTNANYFSRQFKAVTGGSPTAYRKGVL